MRDFLLNLIRLGLGTTDDIVLPTEIDWQALHTLAEQQGLSAIALDGIERLPERSRPPKTLLLGWIGEVLQNENISANQLKEAVEMSSLFNSNYIRTYVLKGAVIAECYPKPNHRISVDMDCFLMPMKSNLDAWALGNDLIKEEGYDVSFDYYKNSTFHLHGLIVENHLYLTPFRGNKNLAAFESYLQALLRKDKGGDRFAGAWLYRPPMMVSALFLIEHAYSHFLHEGLTWRMVLDWIMFSKKHRKEINWSEFNVIVEKYGFRKFYEAYNRLGRYLLGEIQDSSFTFQEKRMLEDVWAPLDLHETVRGLKGKFLLAGNTWRARWKYQYFSDISMLRALWIQAYGVLLHRKPDLAMKSN